MPRVPLGSQYLVIRLEFVTQEIVKLFGVD